MLSFEEHWDAAASWHAYLDSVRKNRELWHGVYERARIPDDIRSALGAVAEPVRLLALSEDWCGDAVNLLPVVARMAEASEQMELRVLGRDDNPALMDSHLTGTSRSIPVVMVLDRDFQERGWWGPRPREIQDWVISEGLAMPSADRYREIRRWYARDRGRTTALEMVELMGIGASAGARRHP